MWPKRSLEPGKVPGALKAWGGSVQCQGLLENLSRGAGGPREPGGKVSGGSWGAQGRCGWGGKLAKALCVPAGLSRAGGGTGRTGEGKGRKRARHRAGVFF